MDQIWQWAWARYGSRYSWAMAAAHLVATLPTFVVAAVLVVAFERSDRYLEAVMGAVVGTIVLVYGCWLPSSGHWRPMERWAADGDSDRAKALESTYVAARSVVPRSLVLYPAVGAVMAASGGALTGASGWRLVQYGVLGATFLLSICLIGVHTFVEAGLRPAREALAGGGDIGDDLPRGKPSFETWAKILFVASTFLFSLTGAFIAAVTFRSHEDPGVAVLIALALTLGGGAGFTMNTTFAPSFRTIRDLADGTERVASGDFSRRLPVVQDDDLGTLAASFNRMQDGLAQRERLQAAFGSYVDPALATRLLDQTDNVFTGERIDVTVMFVDIRDFTPFAEANTAEDTVAHLNALFEIVVPAVLGAGGHVNKYLGDGAMAVFGAPTALVDHADAALRAATTIDDLVRTRFGDQIRIGVGINTGTVIVGTIGGGGKLEFTLIGDTVNVAARIEQLTKTTGDTILLTEHTRDALAVTPAGLEDRGGHDLKGKVARVGVFALVPAAAEVATTE